MWWPSRAGAGLLLAAGLLGLGGCGFQPLYSPERAAALSGVAVAGIAERDGQILRNALLARLQPDGAPAWRLAVELDESRSTLVGGEGDTQRVRLTFEAAYTLAPAGEAGGGRSGTKGEAVVTTSFNEPDPVLATEAAERAATRNALAELADRLVDAVARHLQAQAAGEAATEAPA